MNLFDLKTKKARIEFIRDKTSKDINWAIRGMLAIYSRQTEDEKHVGDTMQNNNVGFNSFDARILTSFAEQYNRTRSLSPNQQQILFARIPKYSKQLEQIAAAKHQKDTTNG